MSKMMPVIIVGLAVALVAGVLLLWPRQNRPSAATAAGNPREARLIIEGQPIESLQTALQPSEMRSTLPEHINLSMIREFKQKNQHKVLVFGDGSELELTPYLTSQLPSEIRLRLEYTRGKK